MKHILLKSFLFISLAVLFSSFQCSESDDSVIWDFYPIELKMYVTLPDGTNLLDTELENSILENNIKAIHNGKAYPLNLDHIDDEVKVATRAYLPVFYGLMLLKDADGIPYLYFGEFDGGGNYENEIVTIDWGDGSYNTLTFDSKLTWNKSEPVIFRYFYLDKEKVENPMTIVKTLDSK